MKTLNDYLEVSEGAWNYPSITSKTIGNFSGYIPKFNGGCFGIIPNDGNYILFSEDDDHYWEKEIISKNELLDLRQILSEVNSEVTVVIDYVKAISTMTYSIPKNDFLLKERSRGKWKVVIKDRGENCAPLIYINDNSFDVSHVKYRLQAINNCLEDEKTKEI
jgi:hypothetical protein